MTTSTILDAAESRIAPAVDRTGTSRKETIEAMREEIGFHHYTEAKEQLSILERDIQNTYLPFVDRVLHIEARAKAPLPPSVKQWLGEMTTLCTVVPNTIRLGIEGWNTLTPPMQQDGRTPDTQARAKLIYDLRACLRNWDGISSRLEVLTAYVENFVKEAGWPTALAGG